MGFLLSINKNTSTIRKGAIMTVDRNLVPIVCLKSGAKLLLYALIPESFTTLAFCITSGWIGNSITLKSLNSLCFNV